MGLHLRIQRGDRGSGPPWKITNIGFLRNTGPDPLKITKLQIKHSMLGHHRPASETPFKWCFASGPLMAHPSSSRQAKKLRKTVKGRPPLTKLSGSAHGTARVRKHNKVGDLATLIVLQASGRANFEKLILKYITILWGYDYKFRHSL